jgi:hypothetical protein
MLMDIGEKAAAEVARPRTMAERDIMVKGEEGGGREISFKRGV